MMKPSPMVLATSVTFARRVLLVATKRAAIASITYPNGSKFRA